MIFSEMNIDQLMVSSGTVFIPVGPRQDEKNLGRDLRFDSAVPFFPFSVTTL